MRHKRILNALAGLVVLAIAGSIGSQPKPVDYTGFWKGNCAEAFGLQILPFREGLYSVSFCGPGGCFEPGTYRPNTKIEGDPLYDVLSPTQIRVKLGDGGYSTYVKCTTETKPVLRYK